METFKSVVSNSILFIEIEYVGFIYTIYEWMSREQILCKVRRIEHEWMSDFKVIFRLSSSLELKNIEYNLDTFQLDHLILQNEA